MASVWVVEKGSYSDYRVVGVFTSKENAQRICDMENKDGYDEASVDEWPLDPNISELNQGLTRWRVEMLKDGSTERVEHQEGIGYGWESDARLWKRSEAPFYKGRGDYPDLLTVTVWATDAQHAVKIVNEMRAEWIALGKWP